MMDVWIGKASPFISLFHILIHIFTKFSHDQGGDSPEKVHRKNFSIAFLYIKNLFIFYNY